MVENSKNELLLPVAHQIMVRASTVASELAVHVHEVLKRGEELIELSCIGPAAVFSAVNATVDVNVRLSRSGKLVTILPFKESKAVGPRNESEVPGERQVTVLRLLQGIVR